MVWSGRIGAVYISNGECMVNKGNRIKSFVVYSIRFQHWCLPQRGVRRDVFEFCERENSKYNALSVCSPPA